MSPFDSEAYRHELSDVVCRLEPFATHISIRGDGVAAYVFARSGHGAIELSKDEHRQVFLELWGLESEAPLNEETHGTYDAAIARAGSWLRGER